MIESLRTAGTIATALFVVSSMIAMGLSLTLGEILAAQRIRRLLAAALLANFVLVPLVALLLVRLLVLPPALATGLLIIATAAGAPILPKLAQMARGHLPFAVGTMVILQVGTVLFMPLVLPRLLPGASVSAAQVARPLLLYMLLPLTLSLAARARWPQVAARVQPSAAQVSNVALLVVWVCVLAANFWPFVDLVARGGALVMLALMAASLGAGALLGMGGGSAQSVLALGTGQRNVSAALVVATASFAQTGAVTTVVVYGALLLAVMVPTAYALGRRHAARTETPAGGAPTQDLNRRMPPATSLDIRADT